MQYNAYGQRTTTPIDPKNESYRRQSVYDSSYDASTVGKNSTPQTNEYVKRVNSQYSKSDLDKALGKGGKKTKHKRKRNKKSRRY